MLGGGPLGHIGADVRDDFLDGGGIEAIDLGEIDAGDAVEVGAEIKVGGILCFAFGVGFERLEGFDGWIDA